MQLPAATVLVRQPFRDLGCRVRGEVVQNDVHIQVSGDGGVDLPEEPQHVRAGVAVAQVSQDLAGGDVHRGEQVDVPFRW